jgi:hypothetical protein
MSAVVSETKVVLGGRVGWEWIWVSDLTCSFDGNGIA